jgi:hypothetical protein
MGGDVKRTGVLTLGRLLEMPPEQLVDVDLVETYFLCMPDMPNAKASTEQWRERADFWVAEMQIQPIEGDDLQKAQALGKILKLYLQNERIPIPPRLAYVALGRRLGYPLKFASGGDGLRILWEGEDTRFEVTELDLDNHLSERSTFSIEHPSWQFEVGSTLGDALSSGHLRVLSPKDELSVLLGLRAQFLESAQLEAEALVAFSQAHQLSPDCIDHMKGILRVAEKITPLIGSIDPLQDQERR